jgi:cytochrome c peroxidase
MDILATILTPNVTGTSAAKTLRQVAETAPYFRDGQAATLDDVINFYDRGGDPEGTFLGGPKEIRPLHLTGEEKEELKEFLKTLTGEPIPERFLRDLHNP